MSKSLKKIVEESRDKNFPDVEMCDRSITNMLDIPGLCKCYFPYWLPRNCNKRAIIVAVTRYFYMTNQ